MTDPLVSVIVPLFNEEENIQPLYRELTQVLQHESISYQLIFVDDGSTDTTSARLRSITMNDPRVETVRFPRNFGQSAALQAGFDRAAGNVVVTMDGDLQNDPHDIPRLIAWLDRGFDVVCGWRRARQDTLITRKLPSWAANWLIGRLTGVRIHDSGCTLRAYRREVIKRMVLLPDMHRFVAALISLSGGRFHEIVVNHRPRRFGRSKYGLGRIWKVLLDLVALKMVLRFASHPSVWFALLSVPFLIAAVLAGAYSVLQSFNVGTAAEPVIVPPSIALSAAFMAVYLFLLGLFAELVVRHGDFRETDPLLVQDLTKGRNDG